MRVVRLLHDVHGPMRPSAGPTMTTERATSANRTVRLFHDGVTTGRRRLGERAILVLLVMLVLVLSILPLARLAQEAIIPHGQFSLASVTSVLGSARTWTAALNSLVVGAGGTLFAVTVGTTWGCMVGLTDLRGRNALIFFLVLCLVIPPQVTALAWLQITGPASPLLKMLHLAPRVGTPNPLYSPGGIILLLGVQHTPLVFLAVRAGLRGLPRDLIEAARAVNARPFYVVRTIVLPMMTPPIVAGAVLCFVSCIGDFGIPAFLGIPARFLVLPTLIFQDLSGLGPQVLGDVAVLSMLIGVVAVAGIVLQEILLRKGDYRTAMAAEPLTPFPLGRARPFVEALLALFVLGVVIAPLAGLLATSLVPAYGVALSARTATLNGYLYVLTQDDGSQRAFGNSLGLAAGAACIITLMSVPLATFIVWGRYRILKILNFATELPYAVPGVVLAIAAILIFLRPLPLVAISIYNTIWIILFAYVARFWVLGLRPVVSALHQVDRSLEEAAQVAGAGLWRRIRTIVLPLVSPAAAVGALLVFLTAFSELTVSALLWSVGNETVGVTVFGFEQSGDANYASAVAVITIAFIIALMLITIPLARRLPPGVPPWHD